ncbi:hypothetical protein SFRURICE_020174 [Spodoptera frugiperda]|nr:hypothetical protein SFRURICE_020174 [Spodoptera frugiperda]
MINAPNFQIISLWEHRVWNCVQYIVIGSFNMGLITQMVKKTNVKTAELCALYRVGLGINSGRPLPAGPLKTKYQVLSSLLIKVHCGSRSPPSPALNLFPLPSLSCQSIDLAGLYSASGPRSNVGGLSSTQYIPVLTPFYLDACKVL